MNLLYFLFLILSQFYHTHSKGCIKKKYDFCKCSSKKLMREYQNVLQTEEPPFNETNTPGITKELFCENEHQFGLIISNNDVPTPFSSLALSNTKISNINSSLFGFNNQFNKSEIKKLDFSRNQIKYLSPNCFDGFLNVLILDLKNNSITYINSNDLNGLKSLKKIDLKHNKFSILYEDTFDPVVDIIDFSNNPIVCNCLLRKFIGWMWRSKRDRRDKFKLKGTCILPNHRKGDPLSSLRTKKLTCELPLTDLPHFSISPSINQIVFEDDVFAVTCEATMLTLDTKISLRLDRQNILQSDYNDSSIQIGLTKTIKYEMNPVLRNHTGTYECIVYSESINLRAKKSTKVHALPSHSEFCMSNKDITSKGEYSWKKVVGGFDTSQDCAAKCENFDDLDYEDEDDVDEILQFCKAKRKCNYDGIWSAADYNKCEYINKSPSVISKISKNLTENYSSGDTDRKLMLMCTHAFYKIEKLEVPFDDEAVIKIVTDLYKLCNNKNIEFLSESVKMYWNYAKVLLRFQEMNLTSESIYAKKTQDFRKIIENKIPQDPENYVLSPFLNYSFVEIMEKFNEKYEVSCSFDNRFSCSKIEEKSTEKDIGLKIQGTIINTLKSRSTDKTLKVSVLVLLFENAQLFQPAVVKTEGSHELRMLTAVKSMNISKISKDLEYNEKVFEDYYLVSPVYQIQSESLDLNFTATFQVDNNHVHKCRSKYLVLEFSESSWKQVSDENCILIDSDIENKTSFQSFSCKYQGVYTVAFKVDSDRNSSMDHLRPHILVVISTSLFITTLFTIICSYICLFNRKSYENAEDKHMLIAILFHLIVACASFCFGLWRTDKQKMCSGFGIAIHYSILSCLMWIAIHLKKIYKKIHIIEQNCKVPYSNYNNSNNKTKPLFGTYLLACGPAAIVCSITASTNIDNYLGDNHNFCWLKWNTSLFAFFMPAAFIVVMSLYKLMRCLPALNRTTVYLSENCKLLSSKNLNTSRTSSHGNRLFPSNQSTVDNFDHASSNLLSNTYNNHNNLATKITIKLTKEVEDQRNQLYESCLSLATLVVLWVFGAFSVATTFSNPHDELLQIEQEEVKLCVSEKIKYSQLTNQSSFVMEVIFSIFCLLSTVLQLLQHIYLKHKNNSDKWWAPSQIKTSAKIFSELQKSCNSDNIESRPFVSEEVKVNEAFPALVDGSNLIATSEKESSVINKTVSYNGSSNKLGTYYQNRSNFTSSKSTQSHSSHNKKPLKLTNLHKSEKQHEKSSNVQYSPSNYMNPRVLAQRHSKVRKALEKRRKNHRKNQLTVLREYAQDDVNSCDKDENTKKVIPPSEERSFSAPSGGTRHELSSNHGYLTVSSLLAPEKFSKTKR